MNDCPVLDIHLIAHPDGINVAPNHGIEPEAAVIAGNNISYDSSIGCDKTILSKGWVYSFNWQDHWPRISCLSNKYPYF